MICNRCGNEYPKNVWKIHVEQCVGKQIKVAHIEDNEVILMDNPNIYKEMSYNELRQEAKDLDLGKNPSKAELIKALEINKFGQLQNEK